MLKFFSTQRLIYQTIIYFLLLIIAQDNHLINESAKEVIQRNIVIENH